MSELTIATFKTVLVSIIAAAANAVLPMVSGKIIGVDYNFKTLGVVGVSAGITALVSYLAKSPIPVPTPTPASQVGPNPAFAPGKNTTIFPNGE